MSSSGSITYWVERLKHGDHLAAQKLWEGYFQQLGTNFRAPHGVPPTKKTLPSALSTVSATAPSEAGSHAFRTVKTFGSSL
jgi:hypothetical protein